MISIQTELRSSRPIVSARLQFPLLQKLPGLEREGCRITPAYPNSHSLLFLQTLTGYGRCTLCKRFKYHTHVKLELYSLIRECNKVEIKVREEFLSVSLFVN